MFSNTIRLGRISSCGIVFNSLRFDIFDHVSHILCSTISAQFFDLVSALTFGPGLIFLESLEDSGGVLIQEDVDSAMVCMVVRKGENVLSPPIDLTFDSHRSERTSSRDFPCHPSLERDGKGFQCCLP